MGQHIRHLTGHVVVGTDGSDSASHAVRLAAREAALRGVPLQVLHAADPAQYEYRSGRLAYAPVHEIVDAATALALDAAPWLDVERTVMRAIPVDALLDASDDAGLIVVGSRGLGALPGLVLGSVGFALAGRSPCPVLVVRREPPRAGSRPLPVVVGVAGRACGPAIELALKEASLRGVRLLAVHAWRTPVPLRGAPRAPGASGAVATMASTRADARAHLAAVVADARRGNPGGPVDVEPVRDSAARALVNASRNADLLVLAARQRPPGLGTHIGIVTHAVLRRAHCPVLVVPVAPNGTGPRAERL